MPDADVAFGAFADEAPFHFGEGSEVYCLAFPLSFWVEERRERNNNLHIRKRGLGKSNRNCHRLMISDLDVEVSLGLLVDWSLGVLVGPTAAILLCFCLRGRHRRFLQLRNFSSSNFGRHVSHSFCLVHRERAQGFASCVSLSRIYLFGWLDIS